MLNLKKGIILVLVASLTLGLVACGKAKADAVAVVDGEEISLDEFYEGYDAIAEMYEMQLGEGILDEEVSEGVTLKEQLVDEVLNRLILEKLILNDAEKRGVSISNEEIDKKMEEYVGLVGGKENFDNYLKANDIDEKRFKSDIEKMETAEAYREKVMDEIKIDEKEEKNYFEKHKEELEQVRARHILVETEEEAKEIKDELDKGGNFEELAKEKSKDTGSAINGGDLDYFPRGKMIKEFSDVAFSMEKGTISDIVKTDYGYHIIKLEDKKDTFESLKENIEEILKQEKYEQELKKLEDKAKIKKYTDKINLDRNKEEENKEENKDSKEKAE